MTRLGVLLAFAAAAPSAALGATCTVPGHEAPARVEVSSSIAQPVYRRGLSRHELSRQADLSGNRDAELGRARSDTTVTVSPQVWLLPLGKGRNCMTVDVVDIQWRIDAAAVDIASDYPPESCPYRAIKDHEDQHVRLTRQAFEDYLPKMREAAAAAARDLAPTVTAADGEAAAQEVVDRVTLRLQPVLDAYQHEAHRLNAAIDTRESYAEVHRRCDTW